MRNSIRGPSVGLYLTSPGAGGASFSPNAAFFAGAAGFAFDLSDASKLFQSSAGITPVTALNDPIGYVTDISGNGKHATQATAGSRPLWKVTYADLDGTDDSWATAAVNLSGTDKVTIIVGVQNGVNAGVGMMIEAPTDATTPGGFSHYHSGSQLVARVTGSGGTTNTGSSPISSAPSGQNNVQTVQFDLAQATQANELTMRINESSVVLTPAGAATSGNFGNNAVYIGRRGGASLPWAGRIYRMIVIGRALSAGEVASCEEWCGSFF